MLPKREGVVEGKIRSFGLEDASICIREGNGNPLQYSCLENPMDGGAWWAAVHGVAEGRTRLSDLTFTFHFHAWEKEMATHSSVLAWRIPGTGEPGGLPSMRSHRVGYSSSSSICICMPVYVRWINNKIILYTTGDCIQYPVINHNWKFIYICMYSRIIYCIAEINSTV